MTFGNLSSIISVMYLICKWGVIKLWKRIYLYFLGDTGLTEHGDNTSAHITKTIRKVLTIYKNNGSEKYSATQYPNGTLVETKTIKAK